MVMLEEDLGSRCRGWAPMRCNLRRLIGSSYEWGVRELEMAGTQWAR